MPGAALARTQIEPEAVVTGIGLTAWPGAGRGTVFERVLEGGCGFAPMRRLGRQLPVEHPGEAVLRAGGSPGAMPFLGAEVPEPVLPPSADAGWARSLSLSGRVALATVAEAWDDARLENRSPERVGLVIGGSNVQQREQVLAHERFAGRANYLRPSYAVSFMDSDLSGACTEAFGIRGPAFTIGGASASGQLAVLQAIEAVRADRVDACIAVGALMDLSYWECQAFRSLGAMGSTRFADAPDLACRPFDVRRDGFVFGESCAAIVVERADRAGRTPYAHCRGGAVVTDAHRNPDPSLEGEVEVIERCLSDAGLCPDEVDYVNPHGSGSSVGDETELRALRQCALEGSFVNTTKSILGHGLSAAGATEIAITLLQMQADALHPSRNLDEPLDPNFNWVGATSVSHRMNHALSLSFGFGGINTALLFARA